MDSKKTLEFERASGALADDNIYDSPSLVRILEVGKSSTLRHPGGNEDSVELLKYGQCYSDSSVKNEISETERHDRNIYNAMGYPGTSRRSVSSDGCNPHQWLTCHDRTLGRHFFFVLFSSRRSWWSFYSAPWHWAYYPSFSLESPSKTLLEKPLVGGKQSSTFLSSKRPSRSDSRRAPLGLNWQFLVVLLFLPSCREDMKNETTELGMRGCDLLVECKKKNTLHRQRTNRHRQKWVSQNKTRKGRSKKGCLRLSNFYLMQD